VGLFVPPSLAVVKFDAFSSLQARDDPYPFRHRVAPSSVDHAATPRLDHPKAKSPVLRRAMLTPAARFCRRRPGQRRDGCGSGSGCSSVAETDDKVRVVAAKTEEI
jgi:hypothetical protein